MARRSDKLYMYTWEHQVRKLGEGGDALLAHQGADAPEQAEDRDAEEVRKIHLRGVPQAREEGWNP